MRLGTQTASVINWMMSGGRALPEEGKGMTELMWSDRYAWEVLWTSPDKKTLKVQRYTSKHNMEGYGYDYELEGPVLEMKWRYKGWWLKTLSGDYSKKNVVFGAGKQAYRDPHF